MGVALFEQGKLGGVEGGVGVDGAGVGHSGGAASAAATATAAAPVGRRRRGGLVAALAACVGDALVVVEGDEAQAVEAFENAQAAGEFFLPDVERLQAGAFGFAELGGAANDFAATATTATAAGSAAAGDLDFAVHEADGPVVVDAHARDEVDELEFFVERFFDGGFVGGGVGPAFDEGVEGVHHPGAGGAFEIPDVGGQSAVEAGRFPEVAHHAGALEVG